MPDQKDENDNTIIVTQKVEAPEKANNLEPYFIQISGRETGQMYKLAIQTVKIGRDPSCAIILDDPHVSRNHAEIECKSKQEIYIRDLGSTNGVFVNGKKIIEHVLMDGDKVLIGNRYYFKFCYQDSLEQDYQQNLFNAANMDALTRLYNKKFFVDSLMKEFSFSKRNKHPLSLMMIDIDFFKKINDTHGHLAGDLVLKSVGQFLNTNLRLENISARYGGEEFSIILRNITGENAMSVAERLRKAIENEKMNFRGTDIKITVSIGIATLEDNNYETIEDFVQAADKNLYEAKQKGRNQTIFKKAA
jgi:diguanylate cyclase (GGDEF)-like protein